MLNIALLILQCATPVAQVKMPAIIKTESQNNPLAIGLNKGYKLKFQPKDPEQAKNWVEYLEKNDYNFDVGLAQINIKNIKKYGYTAKDLLDPCVNITVGSDILANNYKNAMSGSTSSIEGWQKAISAYNTGNFTSGMRNGYVAKVNANSQKLALNDKDIPPIVGVGQSNSSPKKIVVRNVQDVSDARDVQPKPANPYSSKTVMYVKPNMGKKEDLYANNN
ncbi:MAG: lytic transglycosylase domain-containing protein [Amoebophilaceae bacterium]|nr:lytic transglycosylase domain-containing protein [Amoebophilaceae bacterium]